MKLKLTVASVALAMEFGGAGTAHAQDIVVGVPGWPSATVSANVLKSVIEDDIGLEVDLQTGTNPIIFEAMDSGAMQVHPEVWLPNQQNLHDTFVDENGTVIAGARSAEGFQGMCVPTAFAKEHNIVSIDDLTRPEISSLFDTDGDGQGELWIGAPGWASTTIGQIRAKSYGYDETFELTEFDETLAYANLANAIEAGEGWVGYCYNPHYVFTLHDLTVLEEPPYDASKWTIVQPTDDPEWLEKSMAATAWDTSHAYLHYEKALEETHPEVAKFLSNIVYSGQDLSDFSYAMVVEKREPAEIAATWVAKHEDTVIGWMTDP